MSKPNSKWHDDLIVVNSKIQFSTVVTNVYMCLTANMTTGYSGGRKPLGTSHKCYSVRCVCVYYTVEYVITLCYCSIVPLAPSFPLINLLSHYTPKNIAPFHPPLTGEYILTLSIVMGKTGMKKQYSVYC